MRSHSKCWNKKRAQKDLFGFALDMRMLEKEKLSESLELKTDASSKMDNLKLLQLNYVKIKGSYKNISNELRWLCMHGFHSKSIPSELPMKNLVVLDMSYCNISSFDITTLCEQTSGSEKILMHLLEFFFIFYVDLAPFAVSAYNLYMCGP